MSRLKALFNKGFMKLTKGRQLMWVAKDELVVSESEFKEFISDFANNRVQKVVDRVKELEEKNRQAFKYGYKRGLEKSSEYTLLLPNAIREENKHLVDVVSSIAGELLEQGDIESCEWLFKKIIQCRSL